MLIEKDRARRTERLAVEVRDDKRRRDIRMQSLIAPELTPTHARSAALVARLFVCLIWNAHMPNISGRPIQTTLQNITFLRIQKIWVHIFGRKVIHQKILDSNTQRTK